jgi:hypothetical protein
MAHDKTLPWLVVAYLMAVVGISFWGASFAIPHASAAGFFSMPSPIADAAE